MWQRKIRHPLGPLVGFLMGLGFYFYPPVENVSLAYFFWACSIFLACIIWKPWTWFSGFGWEEYLAWSIVAMVIFPAIGRWLYIVGYFQPRADQSIPISTNIDPKQWIHGKLSNLRFIPNSENIRVNVRLNNLIMVDAVNVGYDIRFGDFLTSREWKSVHGKKATPLHTIEILRGGESFTRDAQYKVGTRNPKEQYCTKDRKPLTVQLMATWTDKDKISYEGYWAFRAKCILEDDSSESLFEKKKFHFSLYPTKSDWFGGDG